jgi:ATP-dependent Clp protease ATP-binding subunit ClpA
MLELLSDSARTVMGLARIEAITKYAHEYIGTEHILIGLARSTTLLEDVGLQNDKVIREVDRLVQAGPPSIITGQLPYTPRAKKVLELAFDERSRERADVVSVEHLLLGLIRENSGVAAQVLINSGLTYEAAKARLKTPNVPGDTTEKRLALVDELENEVSFLNEQLADLLNENAEIKASILREVGVYVESVPSRTPMSASGHRVTRAGAKRIAEIFNRYAETGVMEW